MTSALLVAAIAVLILPGPSARTRLGAPSTAARAARLRHLPALAGAVALAALAVVGTPTVAVAAAAIGATAAHRLRRARRDRRHEIETRALLAGLEVAVADLRAGAHPEAACLAAADESVPAAPSPGTAAHVTAGTADHVTGGTAAHVTGGTAAHVTAGTAAAAAAFRAAAATARLGGSAATGLLTATPATTIAPDLDRIAAAWRIAERHGIALAELLDAARQDLLGRNRFRSRAHAGMAGARATATVLAGLPLLGIALGQMMGAAPVRVLTGGGLGGILLVVGTLLACAGLAWSDRITRQVTT